MIEKQDTYDRVAKHLFTQNSPAMSIVESDYNSYGENKICVYRTPDGKKCAVGCLIPDSEYSRSFEGSVLEAVYRECSSLQEHDFALICDLQLAHDNSNKAERFWVACKKLLLKVAEKYHLDTDYLLTLGAKS